MAPWCEGGEEPNDENQFYPIDCTNYPHNYWSNCFKSAFEHSFVAICSVILSPIGTILGTIYFFFKLTKCYCDIGNRMSPLICMLFMAFILFFMHGLFTAVYGITFVISMIISLVWTILIDITLLSYLFRVMYSMIKMIVS